MDIVYCCWKKEELYYSKIFEYCDEYCLFNYFVMEFRVKIIIII